MTNVTRYPELRRFTNRLFNRIETLGGFVFHVRIRKTAPPGAHNPNRLYARVFLEAIKRIDEFCAEDCDPPENFALLLDEHQQRSALIAEAARSMYARHERRRHLIEPPFHPEGGRATAIRRSRRPTGARDWWDGSVRSGPNRKLGPRTTRSGGISNAGSIASAAGAESEIRISCAGRIHAFRPGADESAA